jgi:hypothetical protein
LYWSYANLAMAHAAVTAGASTYSRTHFMIRSRLLKGLQTGSMTVASFVEDERLKLVMPRACCYCGSADSLSLDHIYPRKRLGTDSADNLVWACRTCNSSKSSVDMLEWFERRRQFPPLLLLRRYLKMAINYSIRRELMHAPTASEIQLPFSLASIPHNYPAPSHLILWVVKLV